MAALRPLLAASDDGMVPLVDVLRATFATSAIHKQVVVEVAQAMERKLLAEIDYVKRQGSPPGGSILHVRSPAEVDFHRMQQENAQRLAAAGLCFRGAQWFSVASDAATVGRRHRQNTLLALPSNHVAWAPPVVNSLY